MERIRLSPSLEVSRVALGFWRLLDWNFSTYELQRFVESALESGVSTTDHADIYGAHECEAAFGKLLKSKPSLRDKLELVTKCGIKIVSGKFPKRKIGHYDTSAKHILESVDQSLKNFHTDHIDLLLIHRPDYLLDPADTALAFTQLEKSGKVLNFGVSNFNPIQFEMLNKYYDGKLVTNQVEISPYHLEQFQNGNMEFFLKENIHPMGWSPLAGGRLMNPDDEKGKRILDKLKEIAIDLHVSEIEKVIYAWILKHPSKIIPVIGSGKTERLKLAVDSLKLNLSREQWFEILIASQGHPVP